ncbi:MAG: prephenate dehydratase [Caldilineae bacterium]|nr:MAG: prephenate dehydratase [Caldilineae bacterium]
MPDTVAFQGERGAYSEAAAVKFFGPAIEPLPCESFETVFERVANGEAQRGILPIENSLAGSIHRNYDLLLRYDLTIVGEVELRIAHQLMVLPGVQAADVEAIYSHPQALAQCEHSISRHFPRVRRVATYDTAGSAKMLRAENITNGAAIASQRAAEIYDMHILQADFEDNPENYTRFLIVGREPVVPEGEAKTSIVFSMPNVPGALFKTMAVFALRDIDLTKIESRPLKGKRWQYLFYLDFVGSQHQPHCQNALNNLREITGYLRILGSYPRGV